MVDLLKGILLFVVIQNILTAVLIYQNAAKKKDMNEEMKGE